MSKSTILIVVAYGLISLSALVAAMVRVYRDHRKLRRENGAACPMPSQDHSDDRTIVRAGAPRRELVHS